ncbi:MAG: vWA domain-containing protein [Candidatus Asgardarchaeia archaeon]
MRLFGRVSEKDLLEEFIRSGKKIDKLKLNINELKQRLTFTDVKKLTTTAIQNENLGAVLFLAKINKLAVANVLSTYDFEVTLRKFRNSPQIPALYFMIRNELSKSKRNIFRKLVRASVLKTSLKISGRGLRGTSVKRGEYEPGVDEFDIEETLENIIGKDVIERRDIVIFHRTKMKKRGVLILDTSGSMYGPKILNAALAAAVLAYHMRDDTYSIIVFNNVATVLKKINERGNINKIIDSILDTEPVGYTRIDDALNKAYQELKKLKGPRKWAIIITDGCYNKGNDPIPLAAQFPQLHVIQIPGGQKWCTQVCMDMAKRGKGRLVSVSKYNEIPRALLKILRTM